VLLQKNQPEQALVHAQKAVAANPQNEVCWYRLSQIQGRLGNVAEQQKASAEFQRLHDLSTRQKGFGTGVAPPEVTQQEVDPNSAQ
jgi:predicted Zn-dependent protease